MSERFGYEPRKAFPEGVIALHDEQGVPWPAWYIGPLYKGTKETEEEALRKVAEILDGIPPGPGDEPAELPEE